MRKGSTGSPTLPKPTHAPDNGCLLRLRPTRRRGGLARQPATFRMKSRERWGAHPGKDRAEPWTRIAPRPLECLDGGATGGHYDKTSQRIDALLVITAWLHASRLLSDVDPFAWPTGPRQCSRSVAPRPRSRRKRDQLAWYFTWIAAQFRYDMTSAAEPSPRSILKSAESVSPSTTV